MRDKVTASAAPAPIRPYSQAIRANGFIFASGQIPLDPTTQQIVPGEIAQQTEATSKSAEDVEFLVISCPPSHGGRFNCE